MGGEGSRLRLNQIAQTGSRPGHQHVVGTNRDDGQPVNQRHDSGRGGARIGQPSRIEPRFGPRDETVSKLVR